MASDETGFLSNYLPYLLRRADQALSSPFYGLLNQYGVARSEWRVLAVLHDAGAMPILDLTAAALSPQPTITHAVRRLEERGLVARTHGAVDKRQRIVSITKTGAELTSVLIEGAKELEAEALQSAGDLSALVGALHDLTELVEEHVKNRTTDQVQAG